MGSDWGKSFGLAAGVAALYGIFAFILRGIVRHPFISGTIFAIMCVTVWLDDAFNFHTIDGPAMLRMTESEYAEQYRADSCTYNGAVSCLYDHHKMRVSFDGKSAYVIDYDAYSLIFRDFNNSEDFYRYVLARASFPYQEPVYADMDRIVWEGLDGARRVTLTSSPYMSADRLVIER